MQTNINDAARRVATVFENLNCLIKDSLPARRGEWIAPLKLDGLRFLNAVFAKIPSHHPIRIPAALAAHLWRPRTASVATWRAASHSPKHRVAFPQTPQRALKNAAHLKTPHHVLNPVSRPKIPSHVKTSYRVPKHRIPKRRINRTISHANRPAMPSTGARFFCEDSPAPRLALLAPLTLVEHAHFSASCVSFPSRFIHSRTQRSSP